MITCVARARLEISSKCLFTTNKLGFLLLFAWPDRLTSIIQHTPRVGMAF
jgi:hypothetical protein